MSVLATTALISAIPQLVKAGTGIWQMIQGNQARQNRPEMEIPGGVDKAIGLYEDMASQSRIPGQDIYEGNIRGATAAGVENIKDMSSGGEALGAITQMVAGEQDQFSDIAAKGAEMNYAAKQGLASQYMNQAQWQQQQWDWNQKQKYDEDMGVFGAGMQNVMGALQGATSIGTAAMNPSASDTNAGNIEDLLEMIKTMFPE